MFSRLGRFAASQSWFICVAWLLVGIGLSIIAPAWDTQTQDDDVRFVPDRFTSVRAYHLLQQAFPQDVFASRLVFAVERESNALTTEDFAFVDKIIADLDKLRQAEPDMKIGKIDSYQNGLVG